MDMKEVKALAKAADHASREAAQKVRPAHTEALKAAQQLRDNLAENISERERIRRMVAIIEGGTAKRKPSKEAATTVLHQHMATAAATHEISATNARNGAFWIETFPRYTSDWPEAQRLKVLDALVMASQGKISAGLVELPKLAEAVRLNIAETMAELSNPEAFAEHKTQQAELARELAEAQRYVDALAQAEPRLYTLNTGADAGVAIANHRPGAINIAGVKLEGKAVTELTPEQYGKVRDHRIFKANIHDGVLELTTIGQLVEAA